MNHIKKYITEAFGTFLLSLVVVLVGVALGGSGLAILIPVFAGLTLGYVAYTVGHVSGAHINPAITLGLLSLKRISYKDALYYIIAQFVGAILAFGVTSYLVNNGLTSIGFSTTMGLSLIIGEVLGTFIFGFGVASIVLRGNGNSSATMAGFSLFFGAIIAILTGSAGILNPAVALATNSLGFVYLLAPIVGSVLGMQAYAYIRE